MTIRIDMGHVLLTVTSLVYVFTVALLIHA